MVGIHEEGITGTVIIIVFRGDIMNGRQYSIEQIPVYQELYCTEIRYDEWMVGVYKEEIIGTVVMIVSRGDTTNGQSIYIKKKLQEQWL